jgi:hypothetical protein
MNEAKWVRPAFLSLVGLFGLILMITGLVRGAMAGFHIAEPRYAVADSRVDRVADAIALQSQILVQSVALAGEAPPGFEQVIREEQSAIRRRALSAAKDEAYNDAVSGALQFVLGGFVFLIGAGAAKRAARRAGDRPMAAAPAGPSPFAPGTGPGTRGPTVSSESPVGRLQEAPSRPAAPPRPDPRAVSPAAPRTPESKAMPMPPKSPEPRADESKRGARKAAPSKRPAAPPPAPRPAAAPPAPRPAGAAPRPAPTPAPRPAGATPATRPAPATAPAPAPAPRPEAERPRPETVSEPARPTTPPLASPPRPRPSAPTPSSPPPPPFRPAPPAESSGEEKTEP